MISFIISIILPIVVYLFIQIVLLVVINRFFLGSRLKSQEIINIAIISGLVVTLVWIITSLVLAYLLYVLEMFIGMSGYATIGPVIAIFFAFLVFKKSIDPYVKNIPTKTARNLCVFTMLFNISLMFFFLSVDKKLSW